ncbi:sn-glycerol-3-phosphate ABC transporter ATP-binding protein UgpC [Aureimonas fodinaquatilis]|uniref:sn-glycerol-3-phosphate ABC transporter ATP-binding protein UgpC n=1 Tax=Aureimonas fodinaquatilis TaxID=2565783 RepID=A0A5B0DXU9_9HYPH|nr:sn-glycerol-3-phosphate ABC transporter ATP-binding protein UgpC [Aureimonas fodinaquatilis]KAA0971178.1 sn-glycerol-3-phosphate ABC transporter ATP-binding protein UgpC [Aureimonas fodinaquatilis]
MSGISLHKVGKSYGSVEVLHDIDLEIPEGQMTVLLGPSGCGKSTLLRMIAGLEPITRGKLLIGGREVNTVAAKERGCAMVFQSYALYPHLTVYKNLAFPLTMAGEKPEAIRQKVNATAEMLQIAPYLDRLPRDLSGGQRQRVAMGRAIIREPNVYLFDEPLSNLDAALRVKMRLEIARLQRELQATMLFVTHDQVEAMTLAHQIVVMNDGYVEQVGAPLDIYRQPASRFVATFIGSPGMNVLDVEAVRHDGSAAQVTLQNGCLLAVESSDPLLVKAIAVRPEALSFSPDPMKQCVEFAVGDFTILGIEQLGDRAFCYISTTAGEIAVAVDSGVSVDSVTDGGKLGIWVHRDDLLTFDAGGRAISNMQKVAEPA